MEPKYYYITTPIYYVNDVPHIGHAYTCIAADVLARFMRLDGREVKFLTGTDEHGQKVEKSAKAKDMSPQAFVDEVSQTFRQMMQDLQLTHDDFIRTTEPRHQKAAQHLWQKVDEAGYIYEGSYNGWYSVRDEAYYQESELVEGKAPTGADVEWVEEPSYFFKLSAFQDKLLDFYERHPQAIGPPSRRNEVLSFIKGGLRDLSISRSTFSWGVPVPGDESHVMYVWMDALTNYITALGYPDMSGEMATYWPQSHHMVGKDILRFHCVYWHAFLMAAGVEPPKRVFAHGWLTNNGEKISKSLGNVIAPKDIVDTYGLDQTRYFFMREVPFGSDGYYSKASMVTRINSDLANDYGNLVQRVLSFAYKHCDQQVPSPGALTPEDQAMLKKGEDLLPTLRDFMEEQMIHKYCEALWSVIAEANRYVDAQEPWALRKTDTDRMATVLYVLMDVIRKLAILTQPLVPIASEKILDQLSIASGRRKFTDLSQALTAGTPLVKPEGVFPRIAVENPSSAVGS